MRRETAETITKALMVATKEIDDSLVVARGAVYLDVVKWVVQDYPEMDPGRQET
jgi:hypothetical protein